MNDYYAHVPEIAEREFNNRLAVVVEANEAFAVDEVLAAELDLLKFQEQTCEFYEERDGLVTVLAGESDGMDENEFAGSAIEAVLAERMGRGF